MSEITSICPLCGTANQGGKFCVVCGGRLEEVAPVAPVVTEPVPVVEEAAPVMEAPVVAPAPVVEEPAPFFAEPAPVYEEPAVQEKPQKAKKPVVGIIITLVIALLLAGFAGLVVWDDIQQRDALEAKEAELAELTETSEEQAAQIEDLTGKLTAAEKALEEQGADLEEAQAAQAILDAIAKDNQDTKLEGAYFASDSLLVMKKGETTEVTIYADWDGNATMTTSTKNAEVKWADEKWEGLTTTVKVEAKEAGVCLVTFTNDVDKGTFQILVIITE